MNEIHLTPDNVIEETLFCIRDIKSKEFKNKQAWFRERYKEGLRMIMLKNEKDKPSAYIEFVPADMAWRPVDAPGFMFIHCMYVYSNKEKGIGIGSRLVKLCEEEAKKSGYSGVCVMTSKGSWVTDKRLFTNNGYEEIDKLGRFELMSKCWDDKAEKPKLIDWTKQQKKYKGWHLTYSDQCPWNEKSVEAILNVAYDNDIEINVKKISSSKEAKESPSGFGVFNLIKDGKLIEDHYISGTRFKNILKKEL